MFTVRRSRYLVPSISNGKGTRYFSKLGLKGEELLAVNNLNEKYDTVIVGFTDLYGRLLGKRYDIDYFLSSGIKQSKACTYTFAIDMPMNPLEGFKFANWSSGFGDFTLIPDVNTFREASWLERTLLILCDVHDAQSGELIPIAPRSFLKNAISKLEESVGEPITVKAATELEYYLYDTSYEEAARQNYAIDSFNSFNSSASDPKGVLPAGFYSEDYHILQGTRNEEFTSMARNALKAAGIAVETSKGETGIGQHELNVKYNEALAMADDHIVYKQCLKEIAIQQGRSVTFMAKPVHYDAGSSCHVHLSVHRADGHNLFYKGTQTDNGTLTSAFTPGGELENTSPIFRHFLGGWMAALPDFFTLYCPTVNSYKRLQKGSWAPTGLSYGVDNRTTGFRIIKDHNKQAKSGSMRIECRIPGADVNPYLTLGASILSGAHGLKNKIEPPEMLRGDGYEEREGATKLPDTLKSAINTFGTSKIIQDMVGKDVQEHYTRFFQLENDSYEAFVTDFERKRYFEQI